jgi:hypothetical protein
MRKDWLGQNQDNVSEWHHMEQHVYPWAVVSTIIKIQLNILFYYKVDIISSKCNLFSPWYNCKTGSLGIK